MKRLLSLDILRGITVCGMILVNNAGGPFSRSFCLWSVFPLTYLSGNLISNLHMKL